MSLSGEKATLTTPASAMRARSAGAPGARTSKRSTPSLSVTASSAPSGESGDTHDDASKPPRTSASAGGGVAGVSRCETGAAAAKRWMSTASFVRSRSSSGGAEEDILSWTRACVGCR